MNYKNIYLKIKELLETITDVKEVNTFNDGKFLKYPAINITGLSKSRERTSTCTLEENGVINLVLYQEINSENRGAKNGEDLILDLMDDLNTLFDTNHKLDGLVDDITLSTAELGFVDRELNFRTYNLSLNYKKLEHTV
jgi:hypothetical protein